MPAQTLIAKACKVCSTRFEVEDGAGSSFITTCSERCNEALLSQVRATLRTATPEDAQAKKRTAWLAIGCPPDYECTDWSRATPGDEKELSPNCATVARYWQVPEARTGLGIIGETGRGKTRALWAILKRHHFAGWKVMMLKAYDLTELAADLDAFRAADRDHARETIRRAIRTDLLAIDDIGKEVANKATTATLHRIIEERTSHQRPILLSSEIDGDALAQRFGPDYADGIVRRLRQKCQFISTNINPEPTHRQQTLHL